MTSSTRNASLDTLRVLAVAGVYAHHVMPSDVVDLGDRGVDLFFVLSGYLIGSIVLAEFDHSGTVRPLAFWRDRWLRTLPAYYAVLAAYVAKGLLTGEDLSVFRSYAAFAQSYEFGSDGLPRFHHSWSLCVEEHFYIVLPLLLYASGRIGKQRWALPAIVGIGAVLFVGRTVHVEAGGHIQVKLTHWRTDALIIGVLLAAIARSIDLRAMLRDRRNVTAVLTLAAVLAASWIDLQHNRYFQAPVAIACGLLVLLGIIQYQALEVPGRTWVVRWIARISYSFYLVHPLVLTELKKLSLPARFGDTAGTGLYVLGGLVLSLLGAQALYVCVEKPGLRVREYLRNRSRRATAARS